MHDLQPLSAMGPRPCATVAVPAARYYFRSLRHCREMSVGEFAFLEESCRLKRTVYSFLLGDKALLFRNLVSIAKLLSVISFQCYHNRALSIVNLVLGSSM